jgi:hypothetical protein
MARRPDDPMARSPYLLCVISPLLPDILWKTFGKFVQPGLCFLSAFYQRQSAAGLFREMSVRVLRPGWLLCQVLMQLGKRGRYVALLVTMRSPMHSGEE